MPRLFIVLSFVISAALARGETPEVAADVTSTGSGELILHLSFLTNTAPETLWRALTSSDELAKWAARRARVELRIGGAYEYYYRPESPAGRRGMEGTRIVSFIPNKMLSYSMGSDLWTVWLIEPAGDQQAVHLYVIGTGNDWVDKGQERLPAYQEQTRKLAAYVQP